MRQPLKRHFRQTFSPPFSAVFLSVLLVLPIAAQAAKNLYRYRNAEGRVEISHTIPADRVAFGYEVIDSRSGRVLEVVERQKTQAEVNRINRETLARNACKTALARVNSLYQSELDIDAALKQAIKSLEGRIQNAQLNLRQALDQKRDLEATAAQMERSGKALDTSLRNNIQRANTQVGNLQDEIEKRRREQDDARVRFAQDLALFKQGTCANEAALGFLQAGVAKVGQVDKADVDEP